MEKVDRKDRMVLLFAKNGYRMKGLLYSLRSMPEVNIVVSDDPNAIGQFQNSADPILILIDSSVSTSDREKLIERIQEQLPGSTCVLLAEGNPAFRMKAHTDYDAVIYKDTSVEEFIAVVEAYLPTSNSAN